MDQGTSESFSFLSLEQNSPTLDSFRFSVLTWNVATAEPPDDLSLLLQLGSPVDLYVIGLQEVRAAPLKLVSDLAFGDSWTSVLMSTLSPLGFIKVSSVRMQGQLLMVFSKLQYVPFIRDIRTAYTRTGIYGYWGNKGGVSVRFSFFGHTLCFLNCHLSAHMNFASERVNEFEYILNSQTFNGKSAASVLDHKLVFWFGDLNFRIEDHGMHFIRNCITSQKFNLLWSKDQLTMMKQKVPLLQHFDEGPLDFQPTYKFDLNSDVYDSSAKKRKPAWCDRILWRLENKVPPSNKGSNKHTDDDDDEGTDVKVQTQQRGEELMEEYPLKVVQESYTSRMEYTISDHKPVVGVFRLELRKLYETPLVHLRAEGDWSADLDAVVSYSTLQPFASSSWDWIGLYRVGFQSFTDYITYTWVKDAQVALSNECTQVYVSKEDIPVLGGDCVLCYYSSNLQCIVGISETFKVSESRAAVEEGLILENVHQLNEALRPR